MGLLVIGSFDGVINSCRRLKHKGRGQHARHVTFTGRQTELQLGRSHIRLMETLTSYSFTAATHLCSRYHFVLRRRRLRSLKERYRHTSEDSGAVCSCRQCKL